MANTVRPLHAHSFANGEVSGSTAAKQLPSVAGDFAVLKAMSDNVGIVHWARNSGVTRPDGTTDTTTGHEILAGDETPVIDLGPTRNLNVVYIICDNAGDDLSYSIESYE